MVRSPSTSDRSRVNEDRSDMARFGSARGVPLGSAATTGVPECGGANSGTHRRHDGQVGARPESDALRHDEDRRDLDSAASRVTGSALSGSRLLRLARESIEHELGGLPPELPRGEPYERLAATFVTVLRSGSLHGCIGSLEAVRSLAEDVQYHAVCAAMHDPRSRALVSADLPHINIEISILSALEPIEVDDEQDAIRKLRPGVDGVVLRHGASRATFLPQVWEKLHDPHQFLTELLRKAGLHSWPQGVSVYRYSVEKYEELPAEPPLLEAL